MRQMLNNYRPTPMTAQIEVWHKQYEFIQCPDRFKAFVGGIGSGKTFAGVLESLRHAQPKTVGLVIAPTYTMLRDATLRTFKEVLEAIPYEFNKGEMLMTLPNGAEILFRSGDEPDRLRGPNLHWCYIDEAALCHEDVWKLAIGRLRAEGQARPCWITTTPRGKKNWLYENIGFITVFHAMTRENPYVDTTFVKSLEKQYVGDFAKQELEGAFVSFEGLIYDDFNRNRHVEYRTVEELLPIQRKVFMGLDEGYTNPAVALVMGIDNDNRVTVFHELYQKKLMQEDFIDYILYCRANYRATSAYCDPSAAGLIASLRAKGMAVVEAKNDVRDGIQKVKSKLALQEDGLPRLVVHHSCVNTLAEFESYCWNDKKLKEEPLKTSDHAMDALRYGIMGARLGKGIYL